MELNIKKMRSLMVDFMLYAWVLSSLIDFVFFLYFLYTDTLLYPSKVYFVVRVIIPFLINGIIFAVCNIINTSYGYTENFTNWLCSIGLTCIGSTIAIFHGYFVIVWLAPCFGIFFSVVFQNHKIQKTLLAISCTSTVLGCLLEVFEQPNNDFFIQCGVITICMHFLVYYASNIIYNFFNSAEDLIEESDEKQKVYEEKLQHDVLTQLYSRYYIDNYLVKLFKDLSLHHPVSLAMTDIDDFKHVNDTYGHENGDEVLKRIYHVTQKLDTETVIVARFGGEEFLFMFMDEDVTKHRSQMEEFRKLFAEETYPFTDEHFTISAGLVTSYGAIPFDEVLAVADKALYASKRNGKNQTTIGKL
ncbi:MAG: GGDEF domain-containing protein [Lachnospiraceae bacterium]|nr:GGDEF domain-containing protein [Lachnospiraceae bacterium]